MMVIGVGSNYRGKKIGNKLTELTIRNGKEKGFKFAITMVSDARSRHLLAK